MRAADVRRSNRRVEVTRVLMLLAFVGLSARAMHLSVLDEKGAARGAAQSLRTLKLPPERGHIVDRRGADLALSIDAPSIYVIPERLEDVDAAARALAPIADIPTDALAARFRERRGFQFLSRWVSEEQARRATALSLAGVGVIREPRRVYPHRGLAARVIGFANIDGLGVRGVEQQEDDWLRGTARRLPVERDGSGRLILTGSTTWGTAGGDVALTLDAIVQADAEQALRDAVTASDAIGGVVIVMDPHTGEILALAEAPSFDPNRFRTLHYDDTGSAAFLAAGEPGSVLKPFIVAAALARGAIELDTTLDCEGGAYRIKGKTIRDTHPHGVLDLAGVLRVSSNICAVKIAERLGSRSVFEMLRRFGFGKRSGSRFPDESAGVLRRWQGWTGIDRATIAFGQGISVTAVQLAAAASALANGGELMRPRLVWGRRAASGPWQPTQPEVMHRVVSREVAARVTAMLESVVGPEGTGARAGLAGVRVAGKTGTAQKFDREAGRYSNRRFHSWFAGIAPADAPRIVVVVGLDEPRRPLHTGGMSAAPLFARVATAQLAALGIRTEPAPIARVARTERQAPPVSSAPTAKTTRPKKAAVPKTAAPPMRVASLGERMLLPDLSGFSMSEVMQITESHGLRVNVSGSGRAIRQDPPPGTVVKSGERIRVEFARPSKKERG